VFVAASNTSWVVELSPPTVAATPSPLDGTTPTAVSASLTGLAPGTAYYYRAVASGPGGTVAAPAQSFTTLTVLTAGARLVRALYRDVLNRAADVAGVQWWVDRLQAGASRLDVATAIWDSPEHRGLEVDQLYTSFLHRAADPAGRAGWVQALAS